MSATRTLPHDLISIGCQILKNGLGYVGALVRRYPFIVQVGPPSPSGYLINAVWIALVIRISTASAVILASTCKLKNQSVNTARIFLG